MILPDILLHLFFLIVTNSTCWPNKYWSVNIACQPKPMLGLLCSSKCFSVETRETNFFSSFFNWGRAQSLIDRGTPACHWKYNRHSLFISRKLKMVSLRNYLIKNIWKSSKGIDPQYNYWYFIIDLRYIYERCW